MLHVHRAERADALVDALRDLLAAPPGDPFAPELVAVPTRGMERWLTQRIAARVGVCANVEFPSPRRVVAEAVAAASGIEPDADPWAPERLVWPLLEVVDESLLEPWAHPLALYLGGTEGDPARRARRFATVRHLADLYDRYALYRPGLLQGWAAGEDGPVAWQARVWRRLAERIGVPGPAARLEPACAALERDPGLVALPARLSVFGLTRLPAGRLRVLRALAAARDVHLFLLHPSPALWEKVAGAIPAGGEGADRGAGEGAGPGADEGADRGAGEGADRGAGEGADRGAEGADRGAGLRRADDPTAELPRNRLLASWGRDARELQVVLGPHAAHHHPIPEGGGTLLARLQRDIRADVMPAARPLAADDRSVQVHACHGRARQVEVVRDAILHLLASDPSLEPRDVIVMCPDIETFAPLIQAAFGAADEDLPDDHRPPDLRVRLADRALRQTNPLLGLADRLLELASSRLTASELLELVDREPVRRRFRLDDQAVSRIEAWVRDAGIRWGLDAESRAPFKLANLASGTWRAGLDRILLGVTMTEDDRRLFGEPAVLPLDDVESGAIELAGRLSELVARVGSAIGSLRGPHAIDGWAAALGEAVDSLALAGPRDGWQRWELQRLLDDVVGEAAGAATELALPELRALLGERLQGRPTRANFRTGHLTICTLVPMRSVPHRAVCLLGLDDTVFPRKGPRDGDDLLLDDQHVGDRDARSEDRQLLLDALMAATDRLIVTYTGNDERTNIPQPPAVPVGELLDMVERTAGREARERVVTRHPLQPFDPRNFSTDAPWGFDRTTLEGARALAGPRHAPAPFLAAPLAPPEQPVVELADLVRFVRHPVRAFLAQRLGVRLPRAEDDVEDRLQVELTGLQKWAVGDRLLQARMQGIEQRTAILSEIARGSLPPSVLGKPVIDAVSPTVEAIVRHAPEGEAGARDVEVALAGGRVLRGTVGDLVGDVLRRVGYAKVNASHRLEAWVRLLALTASTGDAYTAVTVGRLSDEDGAPRVTIARIGAVSPEQARAELDTLVALYVEGLREPLPLAAKTSAAFAAGQDARAEWESTWARSGEDADAEHQLVFGPLSFEELAARPGFAEYARRLWAGLLAHERLESA